MTAEELKQIKSAAERIHAASVAAGRWDPKPEWESRLMDIVCDISRAAEASKSDRPHALMDVWDDWRKEDWECGDIDNEEGRLNDFKNLILGTVEDCLADAVIDILDTVEGFGLTGVGPYEWQPPKKLLLGEGGIAPFPATCLYMVEMLLNPFRLVGGFLNILSALQWWAEGHGIDLRRHVELKLKYNETGR